MYLYDDKIKKMRLYESINRSNVISKDQLIYIYAIVSKVDKWLVDYQALNSKYFIYYRKINIIKENRLSDSAYV